MLFNDAMKVLKSLGTEQNRKVYRRHGANGKFFGVSFSDLKALKKNIKTDHTLAERLWASENIDARTLATMIADPAQMNKSDLDAWLRDIDYYVLIDSYVANLVCFTPHAQSRLEKWTKSKNEWVGRAGWQLLALLAMKNNGIPDSYFETYLKTIRKSIHSSKNRTKDAMNNALIAIGIRNDSLGKKALAIAADIGTVDVDHGETSCKTPDAASYIQKSKKRRSNRNKKGSR